MSEVSTAGSGLAALADWPKELVAGPPVTPNCKGVSTDGKMNCGSSSMPLLLETLPDDEKTLALRLREVCVEISNSDKSRHKSSSGRNAGSSERFRRSGLVLTVNIFHATLRSSIPRSSNLDINIVIVGNDFVTSESFLK